MDALERLPRSNTEKSTSAAVLSVAACTVLQGSRWHEQWASFTKNWYFELAEPLCSLRSSQRLWYACDIFCVARLPIFCDAANAPRGDSSLVPVVSFTALAKVTSLRRFMSKSRPTPRAYFTCGWGCFPLQNRAPCIASLAWQGEGSLAPNDKSGTISDSSHWLRAARYRRT